MRTSPSQAGSPWPARGTVRGSYARRAWATAPSCAIPRWCATPPISSPTGWCSRPLRNAARRRLSAPPHPSFKGGHMRKHIPQENSARVLALALAAWGSAVLGAAAQGVFTRLSAAELVAIAIFAMLYAPAAFLVDTVLRDFVVKA